MKRIDYTNQKFGEWTVIRYVGDKQWECRCSCGVIRNVKTQSLTSGRSTNCGHPSSKLKYDLTGEKFGELEVLKYTGKDNRWLCKCSCGRLVEKTSKHLRYGHCITCGNQHNKEIKPVVVKPKQKPVRKNKVDMIGFKVNDITVLEQVGDDRYLCQCKCGIKREIRGYSLRHPYIDEAYKCRHKLQVNEMYGYLKVLERNSGDRMVKCLCTRCNKIVDMPYNNVVTGNKKSCGCLRDSPTYTKEELLSIIKDVTEKTGEKPFALELLDYVDIKETALYSHINEYGLREYLNTKFGSQYEKYVYEKLKGKHRIILHDRKIIPPYELDIYLPDEKIAIEINGNYWHSDINKEPTYHQNKTLECAKRNIRLIHLFQYEFNDSNTLNKINSMLNIINKEAKVLNARELKVAQIKDTNLVRSFEETNHFQGYSSSAINIALIDKDGTIQGLMTFGKPRFNDTEHEYEVIRTCFSNSTIINGGMEKMFEYFKRIYKPKSVLSYIDISKFSGMSYVNKLNFKPVQEQRITAPGYLWFNVRTKDIKSRYQTQKHKLVAKGLDYLGNTENEIMKNLGYTKVYNSGNLKLEYIESNMKGDINNEKFRLL